MAAVSAIQQGILSSETAVVLIATIAAQLGVEIDAEEELKAATAEAEKRAEKDTFQEPAADPQQQATSSDQPSGASNGDAPPRS